MEKQITFTLIKASFTKDLQTFGKMDPFLIFNIGKSQEKTETADNAGKQPQWKTSISLHYYDETTINVHAMQEDVTSNEKIGQGKIDVKGLKNSGQLQIKIQSQGQSTGTVYCKYSIKTLPPSPILNIKNIRCEFLKQSKFMLKTKPYFVMSCGDRNMATQAKEQGDAKYLKWDQSLRVKIKDRDMINFCVNDKEDESKIFEYMASVKEFRTLKGCKKFNVIGKLFQPLGTLQFDYQTSNLVNKEQSQKNQEIAKKQANQLTVITIEQIKGKMNQSGQDIYFKINLGSNMFKTNVIENAKKDFKMQLNQQFYAQYNQNKIIFAAFDKDLLYDDVLGVGILRLDSLTSGQKTISLKSNKGEHNQQNIGQIVIKINVKKAVCKNLIISDIKVKLKQSGDFLGGSEPYIIGRIGGWSGRTQTGNGQQVSFKKNIELKFVDEKQLILQVWQEDINQHDKLFEQKILVENLKSKGQLTIPLSSDEKKKQGSISLKYHSKNIVVQRKQQSKKVHQVKKNKQLPKPAVQHDIDQHKVQIKNNDDQSIQSIYKSRDTLKLPALGNDKRFGDKIFQRQSSSTLQKSILVYSMPKGNRFGSPPKHAGEPSYYVDTCFKANSTRGVGFGFGNKRQFPDWMQKNMKQNPAPGSYENNYSATGPQFRPKGPTFGISYKHYEKVTIPKEQKHYRASQRLKPLK